MKEWLKKRNDLQLWMDEGTHEEFLNLVGPKFQKQDTQMCGVISPNQRLSMLQAIPFLKLVLWKLVEE